MKQMNLLKNGRMRALAAGMAGLLLAACQGGGQHFLSDPAYRSAVHRDFEARMASDAGALAPFAPADSGLSLAEREALEFLYAYMPLADVTDYPASYYLAQVRASLRTREEMGWSVPEREFRHFVLPIRVNNENLDTARTVFFREIAPRVKGLSMAEAILEVNHWCHEKMTYQPSDARTSSPLASVQNALGRCGEESTFCVAALRSVGIPARQVYTPRWAHTMTTMPGWRPGPTGSGTSSAPVNRNRCWTWAGSMPPPPAPCSCTPRSSAAMTVPRRLSWRVRTSRRSI